MPATAASPPCGASPSGDTYPALHRLERAGLLASRWADAGGRRRRVYSLTRRGRGGLERRTQEWDRFSNAVNLVLEGAA